MPVSRAFFASFAVATASTGRTGYVPPPPPHRVPSFAPPAPPPGGAAPRTKAASTRTAERSYDIETLREGARHVLRARREGRRLSARAAAAHLGHPSMRSTIYRLVAKACHLPLGTAEQDAFVDAYEFPKKGSEEFELRRMFSEAELAFFADLCKLAAESGVPVTVDTARELMLQAVVDDQRLDPTTGELFVVSHAYVRAWLNSTEDLKSLKKASPLDIKRAEAASPELRDEWFRFLDTWCRRMHARALDDDDDTVTYWPWETWAEIPADNLYNFDEESCECDKGRAKVIAPASLMHDGARRLFSIGTVDGKMPFHVTDGMTTSASGRVCPPFIVHAQPQAKPKGPGQTAQKMGTVNAEHWTGLRDADAPDGRAAMIGLGVSHSGSMIKELFPEFCGHFVSKVLLPTQGKGEDPVVLFVDGHSSRATLPALRMLLKHNVYLITIPATAAAVAHSHP